MRFGHDVTDEDRTSMQRYAPRKSQKGIESIMGISHRNMGAIVVAVTLLACLGIFGKTNVGAESSRIIDGSDVTFFYEITVPTKPASTFETSVNLSRGDTNCRRLLSEWSMG